MVDQQIEVLSRPTNVHALLALKNHINEKNELCLSDQAISSKAEYSEAGSPPNWKKKNRTSHLL